MVRKIAFKFNEKMAGKDCYYSFTKRHLNIVVRKPEVTSLNRIISLQSHLFEANNLCNADQTGIFNVQ